MATTPVSVDDIGGPHENVRVGGNHVNRSDRGARTSGEV
jgi:hypothetical protein